jgi:hypothetical protein
MGGAGPGVACKAPLADALLIIALLLGAWACFRAPVHTPRRKEFHEGLEPGQLGSPALVAGFITHTDMNRRFRLPARPPQRPCAALTAGLVVDVHADVHKDERVAAMHAAAEVFDPKVCVLGRGGGGARRGGAEDERAPG